MEAALLIGIAGIALVVAVTALAPKVGVAAPLLLVVLGIAISFLPFVEPIEIEPEWILGGILPPLLYSAATNIPAMEFRRDFGLISGFSVLLVAVSAVTVGLLMSWLVPDLPLPLGIALGAIVSPTDAVATSIVKKAGISTRMSTVLEGESLLNDASALVLLRSAVAAAGTAVTIWQVGLDFLYAVAVAVLVGYLAGRITTWVSSRLQQSSLVVAVSLVAPFLAHLPAEHLGGSGLVAAVTAGLVTGNRSAGALAPQTRLNTAAVWRTIELLLESAIFLIMGLELFALVEDVVTEHDSVLLAVGLGALAASVVIAVRAGFVALALRLLARRERRSAAIRERIGEVHDRLGQGFTGRNGRRSDPAAVQARTTRIQAMIDRRLADLDYLAAERFDWRDGVVLVWAGMRGAVTLAAAQSLPTGVPHRSLLVLIAFVVAAGTLLVQGSTLPWLAARLRPGGQPDDDERRRRAALESQLADVALDRLAQPGLARADGTPYPQAAISHVRELLEAKAQPPDGAAAGDVVALRLDLIEAQRRTLLELRDLGSYSSAVLNDLLLHLDAQELGLRLRRLD